MNSDRIMMCLTIVGIAAAVAVLLVTMAVVSGFGTAYERALLQFNAHIVVTRDGEFPGAAEQAHVRELIDMAAAAAPMVRQAHHERDIEPFFSARALTRIQTWWEWGMARYDQGIEPLTHVAALAPVLQWGDPLRRVRAVLEGDHLPTPWLAAIHRAVVVAGHGIVAATPFLYREGLLLGSGRIRGVVIKGIDPGHFLAVNPVTLDLPGHPDLAGALARGTAEAPIPVVLGQGFDVPVDSTLRLFLPRPTDRGAPDFLTVRVVGHFASGLHDYDTQFCLIDLATLQSLYGAPGRVTGFELRLDDPAKAPWVAASLQQRASPEIQFLPWQEMHQPILAAVALERVMFACIMGILVAVAAFNIIAAVLLRSLRRARAIAIWRTLGLSARRARRRYFWWGLRTGCLGVCCGLLIGSLVAYSLGRFRWIAIPPEVYFLDRLPIHLSATVVWLVAAACLGLCALASARAARKVTDLPLLSALGKMY